MPMQSLARLLMVTAIALSPTLARAERYEIAPEASGNLVKFESKAPAESFEGKSKKVSGYVELSPGALGDSALVSVEVDVMTLDTGMALRNEHMRNHHLEPKKYPKIRFAGATLLPGHPAAFTPGQPVTMTIAGTFDLHGVARRIELPVEVTWLEAEKAIHIVAKFQVKLSDYQIARPQFLVMKLDEVQRVTLDVRAVLSPSHSPSPDGEKR